MKRDEAYDRLVSRDIRPSLQRLAIMKFLLANRTHPTVEDVYKGLYQKIPTLSRTTVYNTLRMFYEKGAAQMITIDEHRVCYDGDLHPHVHFFCYHCEKVYDLMDEEAPVQYRGDINGFLVKDSQLYYRGICPKCRAKIINADKECSEKKKSERYAN
ncbi:MAG: transcriptional repressor [Prevotella sp.]|nr:transcriptional repressor [Prevotella sp.]